MQTNWCPESETLRGPLYLAIADALSRDVENGVLSSGTRLPTHRDLARQLGVNVSTITRAYNEAARRGLLDGEVGRGTFVRAPGSDMLASPFDGREPGSNLIDLAFNLPAGGPTREEREQALRELSQSLDLDLFMGRYLTNGLPTQRKVAARWLAGAGLEADPERILVTGGAQHAMTVSFTSVVRAGDTVLCEEHTYPGMKALAQVLSLRLVGVAMDDDGPLPDAVEAACRSHTVKALYVMPTVSNPGGTVMSLERRRALVALAEEFGFYLVEDDSYGFLCAEPQTPLAALAPRRTFFLTSLSKSLSAGLRIGYLVPPSDPPGMFERVLATSSAISWMATPFMAELASHWIRNGVADRVVADKREEARTRQSIARSTLGLPTPSYESSSHAWLSLPEPWRGSDFVVRARNRGVALVSAESFTVGRAHAAHAVRLCLATPTSRDDLARGLGILREILAGSPDCGRAIV